ncbi:hypothetical protein [Devosia geojensis]|uniref:hypothetical protein n=1 Tax=Devosia geojensis TaxID=443610 RepID=UPI000615333C|nr:hypothetical protein [Devosia geojensis]
MPSIRQSEAGRKGRAHLASLALVPFVLVLPGLASAESQGGVADAPEPIARLVGLYTDADANCRLSMRHDALTEASCAARSIYGAALNGEDWCYGKQDEPNATMEWHACGPTSLRFAEEEE